MRDAVWMAGRNPGSNYTVTEWDRRRIALARAQRDVSLRDFAEHMECSHHTLWRIESGRIGTTPLLKDIYKALRLPVRLMGKPDPDEADLLSAYRTLRASDPAAAAKHLRAIRRASGR